jgi:hypothetical protein
LLGGSGTASQKPATATSRGGNGALFISQAEMLAYRAPSVTPRPSTAAGEVPLIDPAAVDHALAADSEEDWLADLLPYSPAAQQRLI